MSWVSIFLIAALVSFAGSIPPGSINMSVMQYAISGRKMAALSFALAACLVEFGYAIIAVQFQIFLSENTGIGFWFRVISGSVLIILGIYNLLKKTTIKEIQNKGEKRGAFLKGTLVALANPLAIPFWLWVTLYLDSMGWIKLNDTNFMIYVTGVSMGTFLLLLTVTQLGTQFDSLRGNQTILYKVPGIIFIAMGIWTFIQT